MKKTASFARDLEEVVPKGLCWLCDPTLTYGYILLLLAAAVAVDSDVWLLLLLDTLLLSLNKEKLLSLPLYFGGSCHDHDRGQK